MILRDGDGKLWIINRKDCKNDASYYEKIYAISSTFKKVKPPTCDESLSRIGSSNGFGELRSLSSKHFPEDIDCEDEDE